MEAYNALVVYLILQISSLRSHNIVAHYVLFFAFIKWLENSLSFGRIEFPRPWFWNWKQRTALLLSFVPNKLMTTHVKASGYVFKMQKSSKIVPLLRMHGRFLATLLNDVKIARKSLNTKRFWAAKFGSS